MRQISVRGTGSVRQRPDTVELTFTLNTLRPGYAECTDLAAREIETLRSAVSACGLDGKELRTASFDVSAKYENKREPDNSYRNLFVGYVCIHRLVLRFEFDNTLLGQVLTSVGTCGVEVELSVRFTVKNARALSKRLFEEAVKDAAAKAEILTKAANVRLGEIVSIDDQFANQAPYSPTRYARANGKADMFCASSIEVVPEDVEQTDSVSIVWNIK